MFISCLALAGRVEEASDRLAELCTYCSPLGLFGDEVDLSDKDTNPLLYPSSTAHISLTNAALYVGWAKGRSMPLPFLIGTPLAAVRKTA